MKGGTHHATEGASRQGSPAERELRDPLTGLPSRALFLERLSHWLLQAKRRRLRAAVCILDLDSFRLINDAYGHAAGDRLLAAVGARLQEAIRPADTLARIYGDEFALLVEDLESEEDALAVARRIELALEEPFTVNEHRQHVSASVGIAWVEEDSDPEEAIGDADSAMCRAKELGGARLEIYGERIREGALARLAIERDLRVALEQGGLYSVYQPIVSLVEGRIVGFESLLRWDHPERGTLTPESFIEAAERSGLIVPIGLAVLQRACEQAVHWREGDPGSRKRVYVNVSARQLTDDDFVPTLERAITDSGVEPGELCLEITETALMDDGRGPLALHAAKKLGVRVVLDDFGTGYSSLTHLRSTPIDEIKIDRSFVEGLDRRDAPAAIVTAVVSMAHALGIDAVAEGVETEAELAKLRAIGCSLAQGFRFAQPMAPDAVERVLDRESLGESLVPAQPAAA